MEPIQTKPSRATAKPGYPPEPLLRYAQSMSRLVEVVQELSLARDVETITQIVRVAARELTGADGATFVLRDGENCYYAEENAIAPLWKGQRFPVDACVSGWVMNHAQTVVIPDIYLDPRVPQDAYQPTFVKSLVMVPIRQSSPIGAIGNYWADEHLATEQEVTLIQALANTTAVAMENVQLYQELEQRVKERTAQLQAANAELETFSYSVSHDLRAPLRSINGFTKLLMDSAFDKLDAREQKYFQYVRENSDRMGELIDALLQLAQLHKAEIRHEPVNLSALAEEILTNLQRQGPERTVKIRIQPKVMANGDHRLLKIALENLLGNAWKYSSKTEQAVIEFGMTTVDGQSVAYVQDNGAGFEMKYADKLFSPFQRLHHADEFTGTGIGLATVARIIQRHQGRIWTESEVNQGATFYFTLPTPS